MQQPFKIVVTTSDKYHHILPMFFHLFNKFWGEETEFDLVGYKIPEMELPKNCVFVSRGVQPERLDQWGTTLREYFSKQPDYFIWMMEDTFIYHTVNHYVLWLCKDVVTDKRVGRIALSDYSIDQYTNDYSTISGVKLFRTNELSKYNLSTQIALWNKDYLLRYLKNDMTPWEFESQRKHIDGFMNVCFEKEYCPVIHNEGVRVRDIYKFNTENFSTGLINELKNQKILC